MKGNSCGSITLSGKALQCTPIPVSAHNIISSTAITLYYMLYNTINCRYISTYKDCIYKTIMHIMYIMYNSGVMGVMERMAVCTTLTRKYDDETSIWNQIYIKLYSATSKDMKWNII